MGWLYVGLTYPVTLSSCHPVTLSVCHPVSSDEMYRARLGVCLSPCLLARALDDYPY